MVLSHFNDKCRKRATACNRQKMTVVSLSAAAHFSVTRSDVFRMTVRFIHPSKTIRPSEQGTHFAPKLVQLMCTDLYVLFVCPTIVDIASC